MQMRVDLWLGAKRKYRGVCWKLIHHHAYRTDRILTLTMLLLKYTTHI
jgi:hypothetical protein